MKLSVIIPVFNEAPTVQAVVERVRLLPIEKEIILINDGSTDGSGEILDRLADSPSVRVFHESLNRGKGAALRRGFSEAHGDVVIIQDADFELNPDDIEKVAAPVFSGEAEVVYGSRFLGSPPTRTSLSWWGNWGLTRMTNLLYGSRVTDMETCYKCFRREILDHVRTESDRFDFEPEFTAKLLRLGYRIHEIPIRYQPRTFIQGKKIGWQDGLAAAWTLLKYRFRSPNRPVPIWK